MVFDSEGYFIRYGILFFEREENESNIFIFGREVLIFFFLDF